MGKTVVTIPTYNERENIEKLINGIFEHAPHVDVLIVDDNSPDGTGLMADKIAEKDKRVSVLHRFSARGRGLAGIAGFKEAIKRKDVLCVIEMDGDFSHDPKYIPLFLKEIEDYDVVIGSRNVDGGKDCRGAGRIVFSSAVNLFIRRYLGLKVKDCTSGYRCFKKDVLTSLDLDTVSSAGPSIVEEILYRCKLKKYRIKEIPIIFEKRYAGRSKLNIIKLIGVFAVILRIKKAEVEPRLLDFRKFGFNLGLALNILGVVMFYRNREYFVWFSGIGFFALISAVLWPGLLAPVKKIVDAVIFSIAWLTKTVTSLMAFYLIFAPIGILLRLLNKDPLHRKIDKLALSYWIEHKGKPFTKKTYERMG